MTTTPSKAPGAMTGARYIESLRDGREVWLDGKRIDDVTTHPAFRDMIKALADVYDLQNSDEYRDEMTYVEPETGVRTSLSWLLPKDREDSPASARNSQLWNMLTWGQLGRSPDILAPYISNMVPRRDALQRLQEPATATSARTSSTTTSTAATTTSSSPTRSATRRSTAARSRRTSAARRPRTRRSPCTSSKRRPRASSSAAASSSRPRPCTATRATSRSRRPSSPATTRASSWPSRSPPTRRA